jgi:lipopolysaccharide transport system ATP-binding protein
MSTAIKVENLSKIYRLGEIGTGTISRDMERWFKTRILKQEDPFLKIGETNDRTNKGKSDIVYSLRDINFEINQGDAVGIVGRNGAGKSTLLKILSRVTTPTTGKINIKGRVASLLEVGTGFHPELTGRENIYLNGAILGMRKREIDRKLDEIIAFSGVERYIDTPVKRYSSGMYVRLAFAVAAHLESEILIVDEVLAVGDADFQNKCLGKMGEVSKGDGRIVLFVSHNLSAVRTLCNSGILLNNGVMAIKDNLENVLQHYNHLSLLENYSKLERKKRTGIGEIICEEIYIVSNEPNNIIKSGKPISFNVKYKTQNNTKYDNYEFVIGVWNIYRKPMFMITNNYKRQPIALENNEGVVSFNVGKLQLNTGLYTLNILIKKNGVEQDFIEDAVDFEVSEGNYYNSTIYYPENYEGYYTDFEMLIS